jgi:hypothetical protein
LVVVVRVEEVEKSGAFVEVGFEGDGEERGAEGEVVAVLMEIELQGWDFVVEGGVDCDAEGDGVVACLKGVIREEWLEVVDLVLVGGGEEVLD